MNNQNNTPEEILSVIKAATNIVTPMDSRFDYDALCSTAAMRLFLKKLGKEYDVYYEKTIPEKTVEFGDFSYIKERTHPNAIPYENYDLVITMDTGDMRHLATTGDVKLPTNIKIIQIDHHTSSEPFGSLLYINNDAASNTRILYDLFRSWNFEIDIETGKMLLLGLLTDSGRFEYPKTGKSELMMAAELIELGVDMYDLNHKLRFNESYENVMYKKLILNNLKVDLKNKVAYSSHTVKELEAAGLNEEIIQGVMPASDIIKYIEGINYAFVIKESHKAPGGFKASLRSHYPNYDVSKIAQALGGGGHKMAASTALLQGPTTVEEAISFVVNKAKEMDNELWD